MSLAVKVIDSDIDNQLPAGDLLSEAFVHYGCQIADGATGDMASGTHDTRQVIVLVSRKEAIRLNKGHRAAEKLDLQLSECTPLDPLVWFPICPSLGNKAKLHSLLWRHCSRRNIAPFFPITTSIKDATSLEDQLSPCEYGYYVKHPNKGGGCGVFYAQTLLEAGSLVQKLLNETKVVIVQHAIPRTLLLPKGPSKFDVRIWALLTRDHALVFDRVRGKTAAVAPGSQKTVLTNKKVQIHDPDFGKYYAYNNVSEEEIAALFPHGRFRSYSVRAIYDAVVSSHGATRHSLRPQCLYWCGYDFIFDANGTPWLLEVNLKAFNRYLQKDQFLDPLAQTIAREATEDFVRLVLEGIESRPILPTGEEWKPPQPSGRWLRLV